MFSKKKAAQTRERQAKQYEDLESVAMQSEIEALDEGDYETAAVYDVNAYVYRQMAERLRNGK